MSYFAEPNYIEYDAWFDENINPVDLLDYLDEKDFSDKDIVFGGSVQIFIHKVIKIFLF